MAEQDTPIPGDTTPSTAIAKVMDRQPMARMAAAMMSDDEMRRGWRLASVAAASGMFQAGPNQSVTPEMAMTKIVIGHDLGISPTQALMGIDLVKGNVQMRAVLLASFVRKSAEYDYRVTEHTDTTCTIVFERLSAPAIMGTYADREDIGTSTFTMAEADRAGLTKPSRNGEPSNYTKYPRNMLFARAMSNGVKWYCPDLLGGLPVYTEADVFESTAVDMGDGDGEPLGLDLGPEVEKVIARATELGHAGLSDRASIEVALGEQPPGYVADWCRSAMATLDGMDAPSEAEVASAADLEVAEQMDRESRRSELLDLIADGEAENAPEQTMTALRDELAKVEAAIGPDKPNADQEKIEL